MAHEYMQAFQSFAVRLRDFQKAALEDWVQEYRGDLGTALTDVVGMDAFLRDFDLYFAKLFDGLRHDSGDPVEWGEKALAHYARLRIDAQHQAPGVLGRRSTCPRRFMLYRHFADRTQTGFGIGTNLTNDTGTAAAEHRHEAGPLQRPAGGQAVRFARQDHGDRRHLPRLPGQVFERPAP